MIADNAPITWDPASIIEPEFVLPEQLERDLGSKNNGASALLWAVFSDGVQTYCREVLRGNTADVSFRESERWIFRPDSEVITSFGLLCQLFEIDARRLRRRLLEFRANPRRDVFVMLDRAAA